MTVAPLAGKQRDSVVNATARVCMWEGSVRSGKTVASLLAWLRYVRTGPAGNLLMVGKTERTLKRNIIDPLVDMLGRRRCRYIQGDGVVWLLGRRVYVAGANDERANEKIRGLTLAGAYVDEASLVPESFWSMLLTRLSIEGAQLFATTNPDAPRHWLKRDWLDKASVQIRRDGTLVRGGDGARLDLARFTFTLDDNPHLPAAYVTALKREFVGLWYRRFILGEWVAAEGAIFDMLDPTVGGHLVDRLPAMYAWWIALDYGTVNPFHAVLLGHGHDDRLYVAREWRWDSRAKRRQLTDAQYVAQLGEWVRGGCDGALDDHEAPERVFVDPSAASFMRAAYLDGWGGLVGADNTVLDGIRDVASLLAAGRLLIHESCDATVDEMSGYSWDEKAQARGEDAPLKQDDHAPDAVRYLIRGIRPVWRSWLDRVDVAA